MTTRDDAATFQGRIEPGPGKVAIEILPESEDYTIPGSGLRMWLPRPSKHEGFTGRIHVECQPYYNPDTGERYDAIYKKDDIVVLGKYVGSRVVLNRREFVVCREVDIVCRIVPERPEMPPSVEVIPQVNPAAPSIDEG